MKKLAALLLAAMMCMTCASALAATTLSLGIYPNEMDDQGLSNWKNVYIPAFKAAMPDVELIPASLEYDVNTFAALAESGQTPDLFTTYFTEPEKLIRNGYVADITEELEEIGWLDKMSPAIRTLLSDKEGKIYGLPRDGYTLGMMLNAELFRDAGLVDEDGIPLYPKTWDELVEAGKAIKEATGAAGLCLLAQDNAGGWHFTNIAWTFGAVFEVQDENGKWIAQVDSPEAIAAMEFVKSLKWEHDILTSDPTTENWGTGFAQLGTGAAAMYIAANDAVAQPTQFNGLPTEDLMLIAMPAGPAGTFGLGGGTPYVFKAGSTREQVMAGLKLIEILGRGPVVTEEAKAGMIADAKNRVEYGVPVIPGFPFWTDPEFIATTNAITAEYSNVDARMYAPYYEATAKAGFMRTEEPVNVQDLYAELTKVIQGVLADKDADVAALMGVAQANFQALLDATVNK